MGYTTDFQKVPIFVYFHLQQKPIANFLNQTTQNLQLEEPQTDLARGENGNVHPGRLTWNLKITYLKRKIIFQTSIIMFHVNLPGCTSWDFKSPPNIAIKASSFRSPVRLHWPPGAERFTWSHEKKKHPWWKSPAKKRSPEFLRVEEREFHACLKTWKN